MDCYGVDRLVAKRCHNRKVVNGLEPTSYQFTVGENTHVYHNMGPFSPPSGCKEATVKLENREVIRNGHVEYQSDNDRNDDNIFRKCKNDPIYQEWELIQPYERNVYNKFMMAALGAHIYEEVSTNVVWNEVQYRCPSYYACNSCRDFMVWDSKLAEVGLSTVVSHSRDGEQLNVYLHRRGLPLDSKIWRDHLQDLHVNPYLVLKRLILPATLTPFLLPEITMIVLDCLFGVPSVNNAINRDTEKATQVYGRYPTEHVSTRGRRTFRVSHRPADAFNPWI